MSSTLRIVVIGHYGGNPRFQPRDYPQPSLGSSPSALVGYVERPGAAVELYSGFQVNPRTRSTYSGPCSGDFDVSASLQMPSALSRSAVVDLLSTQ